MPARQRAAGILLRAARQARQFGVKHRFEHWAQHGLGEAIKRQVTIDVLEHPRRIAIAAADLQLVTVESHAQATPLEAFVAHCAAGDLYQLAPDID
jgi:hypothetical protein